MNFHIGSLRHDGQIPFRLTPIMTAVTDYKQELRLQVESESESKSESESESAARARERERGRGSAAG